MLDPFKGNRVVRKQFGFSRPVNQYGDIMASPKPQAA